MAATKENQKPQIDPELEEQFMQLQVLEEQIKQIQHELEHIAERKQAMQETVDSFADVSSVKSKTPAFVPLGPNIFAEGSVTDLKKLLVNAGANTYIFKTPASIKSALEKQLNQLAELEAQLNQNIQMGAIQAQVIQAGLQKNLGA